MNFTLKTDKEMREETLIQGVPLFQKLKLKQDNEMMRVFNVPSSLLYYFDHRLLDQSLRECELGYSRIHGLVSMVDK